MEPIEALNDRKRLARKIGIITGIAAFIIIFGGASIARSLGYGAPSSGDDYSRGQALGMGSVLLGFWFGLIAYGIARLVFRLNTIRQRH